MSCSNFENIGKNRKTDPYLARNNLGLATKVFKNYNQLFKTAPNSKASHMPCKY